MSSHCSGMNKAFAHEMPFTLERHTPTTLRDSIRTLLGPKPHVKTTACPAGMDVRGEVHAQKFALIAYRARLVALMNILEGTVAQPANKPIGQWPQRNVGALRKPVAGARSAKARKQTAA